MTARIPRPAAQLGFDALIAEADAVNHARAFDAATTHLPDGFEDGVACFRALLARHHAAMLAADAAAVFALRREAGLLAEKLNGGRDGMLAPEGAGTRLVRLAAAAPGEAALWGQDGALTIEAAGMTVRIRFETMLGLGASSMFWLGFEVEAAEPTRPFLSQTGYRSFLGVQAELRPGLTPAAFAAAVIAAYVAGPLRGRLLPIRPE